MGWDAKRVRAIVKFFHRDKMWCIYTKAEEGYRSAITYGSAAKFGIRVFLFFRAETGCLMMIIT